MERLVHRLQKNDEAAFEDFYYLIHQRIYFFILRYVRNQASAQELTQLFFIRVWEKRHKLKQDQPLEAQAFIIARNLVIDELRKKAREKAFLEQCKTNLKIHSSETEEAVLLHNLQEHFEAVIESLPQKRKEIFILSRHQGLTYQEIATHLSISPKTVEAQMSKALKVVRAKMSAFLQILF